MVSTHLCERTFIRFIPLASDTSIGAIFPRNNEATNEETRDMLAVFSYSVRCVRRIWYENYLPSNMRAMDETNRPF